MIHVPSSFWICCGIPITVVLLCLLLALAFPGLFPELRGPNVDAEEIKTRQQQHIQKMSFRQKLTI